MLASVAMALRYSFNMIALADRLEAAIAAVLSDGLRTADIAESSHKRVGRQHQGGEAGLTR